MARSEREDLDTAFGRLLEKEAVRKVVFGDETIPEDELASAEATQTLINMAEAICSADSPAVQRYADGSMRRILNVMEGFDISLVIISSEPPNEQDDYKDSSVRINRVFHDVLAVSRSNEIIKRGRYNVNDSVYISRLTGKARLHRVLNPQKEGRSSVASSRDATEEEVQITLQYLETGMKNAAKHDPDLLPKVSLITQSTEFGNEDYTTFNIVDLTVGVVGRTAVRFSDVSKILVGLEIDEPYRKMGYAQAAHIAAKDLVNSSRENLPLVANTFELARNKNARKVWEALVRRGLAEGKLLSIKNPYRMKNKPKN